MADYNEFYDYAGRDRRREERKQEQKDGLAEFFMANGFDKQQANALAEKLIEHNWRKHRTTNW